MQTQSNSRYELYTAMSRSCQDKFSLRHELVRYALSNGIRACTRQFGCSRNTVREWLRRWRAGDHTLADRSRRPLNQPARTKPALEELVIAARKKTPCFGARRLVEAFDLPVGKGAAHPQRLPRFQYAIRCESTG